MLGDYVDLPTTPLYPFGHGLSYTEFAYGELEISPAEAAPNQVVRIGVDVSNTGPRAGDEVVQLYVHDAVASVTRPIKQLVGFARVPLEPGQTRRVQFSLDPSQLAFYDAALRLVVEPGQFDVEIGASSSDVRASGRFEIVGKLRELTPAELVPTLVRVGR
jgi:beta-glucosidase